mmetsp:Transcript_9394/g.12788  ORF Transcript_9394/g.12788 Transcript_9394/m.12788 type:complete len:143 (-) Transcript_9394:510-938(-)
MRCPEFNHNEALKLFEPPEDKDENMHFFNVKKAFKKAGLNIETYQAKQMVLRFDSNFDEELTISDVFDIFITESAPLNHELERRTVYSHVEPGSKLSLGKQCLEYVRDVFELLLQAASVADRVRLTLNKRPKFTVKRALQVF